MMEKIVRMAIHFMDGSKIVLRHPELTDKEASMIASKVRKTLDQDKIVVQTYDSVIVIPVANIKYIQVTPPPDALPDGVLKNAEIVDIGQPELSGGSHADCHYAPKHGF